MKIKPLISIIIPSFNHAHFLIRSLTSVINQTYTNWEAIVIDNHSKDHTIKIVNEFNDSRIKLLKINNFGIIAKSRNLGILSSQGDWIAFLDSDDWWTKDKLRICVDSISDEVDLIYHDLVIKYENQKFFKRKINKTRKLKKPVLIDLLLNGNAISNSSVLVRKKLIEKIGLINENKDLVTSEDYNTWLKISKITDQFLYLPRKLGCYFVHSKSESQKNMSISTQIATNEFLSILNNEQKLRLEGHISFISGRFNYKNLNYKKAKKELLFVLKNGQFSLKIKSIFMIIIIILKFK